MNTLNQYRNKIIVTVIIIVVLFLALLFVVLRGFVHIDDDNISSVTYTSVGDQTSTKTTKDTSLYLSSGDYTVKVTKTDHSSYIKQVTVPHFLQSNHVSVSSLQHDLRSIAKESLLNVGYVTQSGISTFENGAITSNKRTSVAAMKKSDNSTPDFSDVAVVSNGVLGGVIEGDNNFIPVFYNFKTDKSVYYPAVAVDKSDTQGVSVESDNSGGFSVFSAASQRLYTYSLKNTKSATKQLAFKDFNVASFDNKPLYSSTKSTIAVLEGSQAVSTSDNQAIKTKSSEYKLTIAAADGKKKQTKSMSFDQPVNTITLSKNGNYIFISTPNTAYVYTVDNLQPVLTIPFEAKQPIWVNDDEFVFVTDENTVVYKASVKKGTVTSLFADNLLAVSSLSYIDENKLYFTAFSKQNEYAENPDAYVVDIMRPTKTNNQLVKDFPFQASGYYIQAQDHTLYVQLTRYVSDTGVFYDKKAYSEALDYIKNTIRDSGQYNIKKHFIDIDLR